jgi:hypothetical protein
LQIPKSQGVPRRPTFFTGDRLDPRRLIAMASLVGAAANPLPLALSLRHAGVLVARAATGAALACVYPPGINLAGGRDEGVGRRRVTIWAIGISGACCPLAAPLRCSRSVPRSAAWRWRG